MSADQRVAATFPILAFLLAASALFHQMVDAGSRATGPANLALAFAAVLLLFRPSSLGRFILFIAAESAALVASMPIILNHWMFLFFLNLTFLCLFPVMWLRRSGDAGRKAFLMEHAAPPIRVGVVVMYLFAALAKLNWDFFNPELSCGPVLYDRLVERIPGVPGWEPLRWSSIPMTILTEAGIPLLLISRRTRLWGILLLLAFHGMLGIIGVKDFSAVAFALMVFFLPPDYGVALRAWWEKIPLRRAAAGIPAAYWTWGFRAGVAAALLALAGFHRYADGGLDALRIVLQAVWVAYLVAVTAGLLGPVRQAPPAWPALWGPLRGARALLMVIPLGVFLNGLCPYVGLKTESAFDMFSNLKTEGEETNHLFIPVSWQLFDFQKQTVIVHESSDRKLQSFPDRRRSTNYFQLRSRVSELAARGKKNVRVRYRYQGREYDLPRAEEDPDLSRPYPWHMKKFLHFRSVYLPGEENKCRH